jgi:hypothetical protein
MSIIIRLKFMLTLSGWKYPKNKVVFHDHLIIYLRIFNQQEDFVLG